MSALSKGSYRTKRILCLTRLLNDGKFFLFLLYNFLSFFELPVQIMEAVDLTLQRKFLLNDITRDG